MITVAIVEDDAGIRQSLEWLLKSSKEFSCVASCGTAQEALRTLPKAVPEVILMDINLPDRSGIECTARIKEMLPAVQVVMITVYDDAEKVFNSLRAGASGYILKRATPERISQAIREVHAGGVAMSSEIARKVLGVFREPAPVPAEDQNLSRREQEVLELLSQGAANKEIADKLSISIETVTWHLRHIYAKLHVRSRTQAALKFLGQRKGA
ncbi:MAG TPA: response regulator transcription factor [Verrucomicrobiae bacterium]|jgi:DNA-binding NarL/FixJ family response regulator|nr:response regulator transcription factor [Verrucomicrobiae bacterium]